MHTLGRTQVLVQLDRTCPGNRQCRQAVDVGHGRSGRHVFLICLWHSRPVFAKEVGPTLFTEAVDQRLQEVVVPRPGRGGDASTQLRGVDIRNDRPSPHPHDEVQTSKDRI